MATVTSPPTTRPPAIASGSAKTLVAERLQSISRGQRRLALAGVAIVLAFFGGLALWSVLVPLDSAVVAEGQIVVAGSRNLVQSEKGGVIRQILFRDGDRVEQGQILARLDSTRASAAYEQLLVRNYESQALLARLLAERDGLDRIVFPEDLLAEKARSVVANAIMGQEGVFAARKHTLDNQTGILNQKILQYREEIAGLKVQIAAEADQLALLRQEADAVSELVDKELAAKPRLLALKRAIADLTGSQGNNSAQIARAEQSVLEADLRIVDLKNRQMDEVVLQLRDVEATIGDLAERLRSAKHDLEATELPAPKTGIVVATNVHTIGGVVGPGEVLMEIVPENDALMVEARIRPQDIDHVHVGLAASVRLVGFNTRIVPTVDGSVTYVSADSLLDRPSNSRYYIARVQVDLKAKPDTADLKLQPGMPTHVMVITGTRTLFEYLLAPIADSVSRAMHEI